jgi:AcrR family transcriptional regulator
LQYSLFSIILSLFMTDPVPCDPRIKRTKELLFQALTDLLAEKSFDSITMQDIAERSSLNRGTIYDHFQDKFALLQGMVDEKFRRIFSTRMAGAQGNCSEAIRQLILTVVDFLGEIMGCTQRSKRPFEPVVESTIRGSVRSFLLQGLQMEGGKAKSAADAELRATAASWVICGTVLEWTRTRAIPPEFLADQVLLLISDILYLATATALQQVSANTSAQISPAAFPVS